ncbi:hypothetical protein D4S03_07140 [bacterium]|nr:MAG: hypothetical protein D4S03_07140 [bacterium]
MKIVRMIMVFVAVIFFITPLKLSAAEGKFELQQPHVIKEVLIEFTGKEVSVRLESGGVFEGIITKVGDYLVHISGIASREFSFDAYIRIDKINSVVITKRRLERTVR